MSLQLGQIIDGKYRIVRLIGEGGMGAVYEGENVRIRRRVAIKLLHAGVASNAEMVQRFEREAQVAGTVGNDHILEILDLGVLPDGDRFMVMEYLDGETLTDRIQARGRLQAPEAIAVVRQVLEGLAAAHNAGIVHRDLKPDNVFVLKEKAGLHDYVKIIDFGISKFAEPGGASSRMTRTGALMGTPHYMAPEQATGSSEVDSRTDLYAVGIILYEAVTGRVPFQAETFNQLLFEIALAKITPAGQLVPDLDPAFDSIILRATSRVPSQRFQTCAEFIAALDEWERTGSAVSLPPDQSLEAIVAATVPRAASNPSIPGTDATVLGTAEGGNEPSGAVARTALSAGTPAPVGPGPAAPKRATVNSWANSSQASPPAVGRTPLFAATAVGICLLVGALGGVLHFRHGASAVPASVSGDPVVAPAIPVTPVVQAPSVTPAASVAARVVPEAPSATPPEESGKPEAVHSAGARSAATRVVAREASEKRKKSAVPAGTSSETAVQPKPAPKPKEATINFGY